MTIEIRELIIEARVTVDGAPTPSSRQALPLAHSRMDEERWIARITQRVLDMLREQRGGA